MVDLKSLLGKLNSTSSQALEKAAARCVAATHYNVELEHFLLELVEAKADLVSILRFTWSRPATSSGSGRSAL